MEHWYLHPAICVYSRKPGVLHSAPLARVPSMHLVNGPRPPRIRAFIRLQGAESRCTQRCLPIGSRQPQVWPIATYRSADTTSPCQSDFSPIVLLSPSLPLSLPRHVDIVYDEMACLPSTSRENIIDVARRKAQGGSPRFNIGNIDSILETCQWGTTLDSIS